MTMER